MSGFFLIKNYELRIMSEGRVNCGGFCGGFRGCRWF